MSSKTIYQQYCLSIYQNLCLSRKRRIKDYAPYSGLHKHHITPRHSGGTEDEDNFTYLTIREHRIAHYLLWRVYRITEDLGAYKMLGGNLTVEKRRILGKNCVEKKIGIWSDDYTTEMRREASRKGGLSQVESKLGIHVEDESLRLKWASAGGKASWEKNKHKKLGVHGLDEETKLKNCSKGGKSMVGMKLLYNPITNHKTKVKCESEIQNLINSGYVVGWSNKHFRINLFGVIGLPVDQPTLSKLLSEYKEASYGKYGRTNQEGKGGTVFMYNVSCDFSTAIRIRVEKSNDNIKFWESVGFSLDKKAS
jgi:hypothetical protein